MIVYGFTAMLAWTHLQVSDLVHTQVISDTLGTDCVVSSNKISENHVSIIYICPNGLINLVVIAEFNIIYKRVKLSCFTPIFEL